MLSPSPAPHQTRALCLFDSRNKKKHTSSRAAVVIKNDNAHVVKCGAWQVGGTTSNVVICDPHANRLIYEMSSAVLRPTYGRVVPTRWTRLCRQAGSGRDAPPSSPVSVGASTSREGTKG